MTTIAQTTLTPRAWLELALISSIWGASFLSIRVTLDELSLLNAVAWRVAPAALVLWIYVALKGIRVPRAPKIWAAFFIMGALNNAIPFTLMAWGQLYIETGLTSILNASTAIFGVVFAAIFFADERLRVHKVLGVSLGFMGVATAIGLGKLLTFDLRSLAQLAVIAGTISYASAGIWARKMLQGIPPQVAAAGMLTGASAIMVPAALILEGLQVPTQAATWAAVTYMSCIATALAYLLYYRILKMAGTGNLMLCTLLVAPIAILLGAIFRAEALGTQAYLGFALLAIGLTLIDGKLYRRWLKVG